MSLQAKGVIVCISIAALIFFILIGALSLSKPTQKLGEKAASSSTNLTSSSTNLAGITNHLAGLSSAIGNALFGETRRKQKIAQSIENQHAIGKAYAAYLADNDGWYPVVRGAAGVGGKTGNSRGPRGPLPAVVGKFYGASVPEKERPLNAYIGSIKSFHDPADTGGGAYNVHSSWDSFGNSYQPQVADDMFRVKRILGEKSEKKDPTKVLLCVNQRLQNLRIKSYKATGTGLMIAKILGTQRMVRHGILCSTQMDMRGSLYFRRHNKC